MIQEPRYMFVIKDASGNQYEFQKATERAYEHYENDVGRCRFFVPYNDLKLTTSSVVDNAFSEILIYRNETLVWQGMVQMIQDVVDGVWVYGETYLAALAWYGVRYDQEYTTANISTLIGNEYDNIVGRASDFLQAKITKGTIENPYQTDTTNALTVTRTLFNESFLNVLKEMVAVSKGEETSTWSQNTVFDISFSATAPTFTFKRNAGSAKADVIFELDSEIVDFNIVTDMRYITNESKGFVVTEGPKILTSTESAATSASTWYRRESYPYYPNVTSQADLDHLVDNVVANGKSPGVSMNLKFAAGLAPLDGYSISDNVKLRIKRGRIDIDEYRKVVGMEVNIDNAGVENTVPILQKLRT